MVSTLPSAPAATARAMKASGSSQNTSIRAEGIPSFVGLSQPLFAGSPTKKGAPANNERGKPGARQTTPSGIEYDHRFIASTELLAIDHGVIYVDGWRWDR